jgi:integrase
VVNDVWLRAARVIFGWGVSNRKLSSNPFEGIAVAAPKGKPKLRDREFTSAEVTTILSAALEPPSPGMAAHNKAARRWVPWLCAYSGARPGEITQLRAEDVRKVEGIWSIRITPEAGTVKGGHAREVPIHEHLAEQGFIRFVGSVGSGPLFYDPEARRMRREDPTNPGQPPWVKARVKLAEWVREIGVTDPNISPNHGATPRERLEKPIVPRGYNTWQRR